jgi:hypothetical protein
MNLHENTTIENLKQIFENKNICFKMKNNKLIILHK